MEARHIVYFDNPLTQAFVETAIRQALKHPECSTSNSLYDLKGDIPYVAQVVFNSLTNPIKDGRQLTVWDMRDFNEVRNRFYFNQHLHDTSYRLQSAADQTLVLLGLIYEGFRRTWNSRKHFDVGSIDVKAGIDAGVTFYRAAAKTGRSENRPEADTQRLDTMAENFPCWVQALSILPKTEQVGGFLINVM